MFRDLGENRIPGQQNGVPIECALCDVRVRNGDVQALAGKRSTQ